MSILVIVQARLGSSRLPSKVLEPIGDFPALFHTVMRARHALPNVVVAAPRRDVPSLRFECAAEYFGWGGEENDVLGRFAACVKLRPATTIVRLTGDCPFVDPEGIKAVADAVESGEADYAWTGDQVNGLDAEAFTADLLRDAHEHATDPADREHVTPWMRRHSRVWRYTGYDALPRYRWTLDTTDDLYHLRDIAELIDTTPPDPSPAAIHALIQAHPHLTRLEHAA